MYSNRVQRAYYAPGSGSRPAGIEDYFYAKLRDRCDVDPSSRVSTLALMEAGNSRNHICILCNWPRVTSWYGDTEWVNSTGIYGVNLVHLGDCNSTVLAIAGDELPTMCGGASLFIANANHMSSLDLSHMCGVSANCGVIGSSGSEAYDEYEDDYEYTSTVKGLLGQIIVEFSRHCCTATRRLALDYLEKQFKAVTADLNSGLDLDDVSTPESTTVKWLSRHVVGLFTAYHYRDTNDDYDYGQRDEGNLDSVMYYSHNQYGTTPPHTTCRGRIRGMAGPKTQALTNINTVMGQDSIGTRVRNVLAETIPQGILPAMLNAIYKEDRTFIMTDNLSGCDGGAITVDVIEWFCEDSDKLQEIISIAAVCGNHFRWNNSGIPRLTTIRFPISHNPNEGAHEITGCSVAGRGGDVVMSLAPRDNEEWYYE